MNELFNVKDKVVVITGGAGILGKGIAAYLAKEGAKVVVLDRSEEAGKALVESIKAEGNEAMFLYTDVMDKETSTRRPSPAFPRRPLSSASPPKTNVLGPRAIQRKVFAHVD